MAKVDVRTVGSGFNMVASGTSPLGTLTGASEREDHLCTSPAWLLWLLGWRLSAAIAETRCGEPSQRVGLPETLPQEPPSAIAEKDWMRGGGNKYGGGQE